MIRLALALAAAALVATPAAAQLAPGYSGYSSAPVEGSEKDYWYLIRQMGSCLSRSKPEETLAFLATEPASAEAESAFDLLFHKRNRNPCMQNFVEVTFLRGHLRGQLAEVIYRRRIEDVSGDVSPTFRAPKVVGSIHDFAACYVAQNYDLARNLVFETKASTKGELQFLKQIGGTFGPCIPEGAEIRMVPVDVRYALAEALYRTTYSPEIASMNEATE